MIHKLTPEHLENLKTRKNWFVFFIYVLALPLALVIVSQLGVDLFVRFGLFDPSSRYGLFLIIFLLALAATVLSHRYMNQKFDQRIVSASKVEVEVTSDSLVWKSEVGSTRMFLSLLKDVTLVSPLQRVDLKFKNGQQINLEGLSEVDYLVAELRKHVKA